MKIYIEDVILINFLVNIVLILTISSCLKIKINKPKSIFSCFIVSFFSLIYGVNFINIYIKYLLEILLSLFALSFSFKNLNTKKLFHSFLLLTLLSNFYTGLLLQFGYKTNFGAIIGNFYSSILSLILISTFAIFITKILTIITNKQKLHSNICKVEIFFKDKTVTSYGYFDTGNNLSDNTCPVNIVNFKLFENLTNINLSKYISHDFELKDASYIETSTLTGTKKLFMFTIDKMIIIKNNKQEIVEKPKLALSLNLHNNKDYDIILNNSYI